MYLMYPLYWVTKMYLLPVRLGMGRAPVRSAEEHASRGTVRVYGGALGSSGSRVSQMSAGEERRVEDRVGGVGAGGVLVRGVSWALCLGGVMETGVVV